MVVVLFNQGGWGIFHKPICRGHLFHELHGYNGICLRSDVRFLEGIIIAGAMLGILGRELDTLRHEFLEWKNSKRLLIALNEWKRKHLVSAGLIDRINNCFGFIILLLKCYHEPSPLGSDFIINRTVLTKLLSKARVFP